jgi:hypothetical protein
LDDKTKQRLEDQYEEVVDKQIKSSSANSGAGWGLGVSPETLGALGSISALDHDEMLTDFDYVPPENYQITQQRSIHEQERYDTAHNELIDVKSQLNALERERESLQNQKERLQPDDLVAPVIVNIITIILSVVVPMMVYLLVVLDFPFTAPNWTQNGKFLFSFFSWLIGLAVVFDWLGASIIGKRPLGNPVYEWIQRLLIKH